MYGDKSKPKLIQVFGYHGVACHHKKFNIEYFITETEFRELRDIRKMHLTLISKEIGFEGSDTAFRKSVKKMGWDDNPGFLMYDINCSFFGRYSRQSAWTLGWIVTDGHVRKHTFSLGINDLDVLQKIKNHLNYEGPITKVTDKKYSLAINRTSMVNDIVALGVPLKNKTFACSFPEMPDMYKWDFVRGAFEGDGSVIYDGSGIKLYICGASVTFIDQLRVFLEFHGIKTSTSSRGNTYYLRARNTSSALRWAYFMYADTNDSIRMRRKFEKFTEFVRNFHDRKRRSTQCIELVEKIRVEIPECEVPEKGAIFVSA